MPLLLIESKNRPPNTFEHLVISLLYTVLNTPLSFSPCSSIALVWSNRGSFPLLSPMGSMSVTNTVAMSILPDLHRLNASLTCVTICITSASFGRIVWPIMYIFSPSSLSIRTEFPNVLVTLYGPLHLFSFPFSLSIHTSSPGVMR